MLKLMYPAVHVRKPSVYSFLVRLILTRVLRELGECIVAQFEYRIFEKLFACCSVSSTYSVMTRGGQFHIAFVCVEVLVVIVKNTAFIIVDANVVIRLPFWGIIIGSAVAFIETFAEGETSSGHCRWLGGGGGRDGRFRTLCFLRGYPDFYFFHMGGGAEEEA
ncbi:hypothetical protein BDD12DRAFT_945290 [Trichophaea hybrida]|nr:hypothetical protein BDD12DRAFT_945290 [Trichophaea hybrida]